MRLSTLNILIAIPPIIAASPLTTTTLNPPTATQSSPNRSSRIAVITTINPSDSNAAATSPPEPQTEGLDKPYKPTARPAITLKPWANRPKPESKVRTTLYFSMALDGKITTMTEELDAISNDHLADEAEDDNEVAGRGREDYVTVAVTSAELVIVSVLPVPTRPVVEVIAEEEE